MQSNKITLAEFQKKFCLTDTRLNTLLRKDKRYGLKTDGEFVSIDQIQKMFNIDEIKQMATIDDALEILGIDKDELLTYVRHNKIRHFYKRFEESESKKGARFLFYKDDLIEFKEKSDKQNKTYLSRIDLGESFLVLVKTFLENNKDNLTEDYNILEAICEGYSFKEVSTKYNIPLRKVFYLYHKNKKTFFNLITQFALMRSNEYQKLVDDFKFSITELNIAKNKYLALADKLTTEEDKQNNINQIEHTTPDQEILLYKLLDTPINNELDLSVRAIHCLINGGFKTIGDVILFVKSKKTGKNELLKFRGFGEKTLDEIENIFYGMGVSFNMGTKNYSLYKEAKDMKKLNQ